MPSLKALAITFGIIGGLLLGIWSGIQYGESLAHEEQNEFYEDYIRELATTTTTRYVEVTTTTTSTTTSTTTTLPPRTTTTESEDTTESAVGAVSVTSTECGGKMYPDDWYSSPTMQGTPDDPMPNPSACPEEYGAWLDRQQENVAVSHCVYETDEFYFWTFDDPMYETYLENETGLKWRCIGYTPSEWIALHGHP